MSDINLIIENKNINLEIGKGQKGEPGTPASLQNIDDRIAAQLDTGGTIKEAVDTKSTSDRAYADGLVVGLWDDRGNYDASGGIYPSTGGSGSAGAMKKGDTWTISVAGTLPTAQVVEVGDVIRALIDAPGQTQSNWAIQQNNIGYSAENSANKDTDGTLAANSDTKYASQKAVKTYVTSKTIRSLDYALSDQTTAIATGTPLTCRVPYAFTISSVKASLKTAQASGSLFTLDIKKNGTSIFSTLLTFDNTEKTTVTAATAAVLSTTSLTDDDELTFIVTQIGNGTAIGLVVYIIGYPT